MALFDIKKKKALQYLLLTPIASGPLGGIVENQATWEVLEAEELERRVEENDLDEDCRLFVVDREISIRFEKTTHLD